MKTFSKLPDSEKQNEDKTRVVSRVHDILMAINNHPDGLTLREICNYTKIARSTAQRILGTMDGYNWIISAPFSGAPSTMCYRLGPTLTLFATNVRPFDVAEIARPLLMQLANQTDESVYLCVVLHDMAVVVDLIYGKYPLQSVTTMGTSLPLHATACGKALLAYMPGKALENMRNSLAFDKFTQNTITNWDDLMVDLEKIRDIGLAFDFEEHHVGLSAIAVPVKGPAGELGVISIPMPTERFQVKKDMLVGATQAGVRALQWRKASF